MSDIDFDELDKAVNTLMSDVPKVEPPKTDDIKTLTINSTLSDDSRPSLANLDSTLTEVNGTATQPAERTIVSAPVRAAAPSLASRRGGRFMDVVHPSSDMKTAAKTAPTSRQGVTIEPTGKVHPETSDNQSNKIDEGIAPESYQDLTVSDVAVEPKANMPATAERHTSTNDWPDPLEMSGYNTEPDTNGVEQPIELSAVAETTEVTEADNANSEIVTTDQFDYEDPQPLTSPFITDAKVEKRPLGGAPVDVSVEEPGRAPVLGALAADDEMTNEVSANDQLPATPGDVETQLPPELQRDLMAIETDGDTSTSEIKASEPVAVTVDAKPAVEVQDAPVAESAPVAAEVAKSSAEPAASTASVGPTSIPQQYHEEPSTSDESNGSIYDTDSYHQPLAHPAKTKSGWLWIIWILLLLIVGGGGAVALYVMGIF